MRTRRSPRNQDILFKALFKPPTAPKRDELAIAEAVLAKLRADPLAKPRLVRDFEKKVQRLKLKALRRKTR